MSRSARHSMITARAEACLREVELTAGADRQIVGVGIYADHRQVLANVRRIKQQATEAEILLYSLDRAELPEVS